MTAEEAIKLIEHISITFVPTDQYGDYDDPQPYEEALDMAIEALSADAVEVVRCKDCKHYLNEHICMYFSRHGTIETSSYAYCSYGERIKP